MNAVPPRDVRGRDTTRNAEVTARIQATCPPRERIHFTIHAGSRHRPINSVPFSQVAGRNAACRREIAPNEDVTGVAHSNGANCIIHAASNGKPVGPVPPRKVRDASSGHVTELTAHVQFVSFHD